ncbi:MAG: hypothetical protein HOP08_00615 [Cyclobacteriaceae bacterium]|nr:hypothetical protein [Cyclobacteriaceae bacterium]
MEDLKDNTQRTIDAVLTRIIGKANDWFNRQSLRRRKQIVIGGGGAIALISLIILVRAFTDQDNRQHIDTTISQPMLMPMPLTRSNEQLTPLGKMKGEIDGEFEAFYLAVDSAGTIYMNREPPFENAYEKSPDWKAISREKLKQYEQVLHFLPIRGKGARR